MPLNSQYTSVHSHLSSEGEGAEEESKHLKAHLVLTCHGQVLVGRGPTDVSDTFPS